MADCPSGSELKPGIPDGLVRVRRLDFTPTSIPRILRPFYRRQGASGWDVDLAEALSPETVSSYGVLYEGELLSTFCSGSPPTVFPNYLPSDGVFLRGILARVWNQNCRCKQPPSAPCCGVWGGKGQGRNIQYRVRHYGSYIRKSNPGTEQFVDTTTTQTGSLCESAIVVGAQNGRRLQLRVGVGTAFPSTVNLFGASGEMLKFDLRVDPASIVRADGQPDNFCEPVPEPSYPEDGMGNVIIDGSRPPGARNDADVVVITVPALPGERGADGTNGRDGTNGLPGAPGRDGMDGSAGLPGRNGIDGQNGGVGAAGAPGAPGAPGAVGAPGAPGQDGIAQKISIRSVAKVALGVASFFQIVSETEAQIVYDLFLEESMDIQTGLFSVKTCVDGVVETASKSIGYVVTSDGSTVGQVQSNVAQLNSLIECCCDDVTDLVPVGSVINFEFQSESFAIPLEADYVEVVMNSVPDSFSRTNTGNEANDRFRFGDITVLRGEKVITHVEIGYKSYLLKLEEFCTRVHVAVLPPVVGVLRFYKRSR